MASALQKRLVRKGHTTGQIGLWRRQAEHENSSSVDVDLIKIREEAKRRFSVKDLPKLEVLDQVNAIQTLAPVSLAASTMAAGRMRKTSDISRPSFKIQEESEGQGFFATAIMMEKPRQLDIWDHEPNDLDREMDFEPENKIFYKVHYALGRRGSKTTDDLMEYMDDHDHHDDNIPSHHDEGIGSVVHRSNSIKGLASHFGSFPFFSEKCSER